MAYRKDKDFHSSKYGSIASVDGVREIVSPLDSALKGKATPITDNLNDATHGGGRITGYMPYFIDATDALANRGFMVSFQHVPSNTIVGFKAFVTAFNETYNSDWAAENVYGRPDPIYMYKNTVREITLAINIPASTEGEAFENLGRVQDLVKFLYPSYEDIGDASTIANSPLVRLQVMNLLAARPSVEEVHSTGRTGLSGEAQRKYIANNASKAKSVQYNNLGSFESLVKSPGANTMNRSSEGFDHAGVLGVIKNLTVNHNLENTDIGVFEISNGTILPKMIEINLSFGVIHEHTTGWTGGASNQSFATGLFPYGVQPRHAEDFGAAEFSGTARKFNTDNRNKLLQDFDDIPTIAENQQDIANSEARYSGLFKKSRFEGDQEKIKKALAVEAAHEKRYGGSVGGGARLLRPGEASDYRKSAAKAAKARQQREYYESAQRGLVEAGGWDEFVD